MSIPERNYRRRDKSNGQWRLKSGLHIHTKGYPRVTCGPLRHQLVHRIVAAAMLGRELTKDEEVHHRDTDKRNFHWRNLFVMGQRDHSWVSQKQAWFMREKDAQEKLAWDKFMDDQAEEFYQEVAAAKTEGVPWECMDGKLRREWEQRERYRNSAV